MTIDDDSSTRAARLTASRFLGATPDPGDARGASQGTDETGVGATDVAREASRPELRGLGRRSSPPWRERITTVTLLATALAAWTTRAWADDDGVAETPSATTVDAARATLGESDPASPATRQPTEASEQPTPNTPEATPPSTATAPDGPASPATPAESGDTTAGAEGAGRSIDVRRVLEPYAREAAARRYTGSATGLVSAGALLGIGFAAQGPDMTASHWLWASSAVVGLGSIGGFFARSELEELRDDGRTLDDEELRQRWRKVAEETRTARHVGAIFSTTLGVASIVTGTVFMASDVGDLAPDDRTALGSVLLTGGALSIAGGITAWFTPSPAETGYTIVDPDSDLSVCAFAGPIRGGAAAGVVGRF